MLKRRRDGEGKNHGCFSGPEKTEQRNRKPHTGGPGRDSKKYDFRKDLDRFNRKGKNPDAEKPSPDRKPFKSREKNNHFKPGKKS